MPNQQSLLFIAVLAFALILLLPMLSARTGLTGADLIHFLFGRIWKRESPSAVQRRLQPSKPPRLSNSHKGELTEFLAQLLPIARRQKIGLVYPGTLLSEGEVASLFAILVTRTRIIGVNCFGYAGQIHCERADGTDSAGVWTQQLNGQSLPITNPCESCARQQALLNKTLIALGLEHIPHEVIGVFTNRHAVLENGAIDTGLYSRQAFFDYLLAESVLPGTLNTAELARQMKSRVKLIKK